MKKKEKKKERKKIKKKERKKESEHERTSTYRVSCRPAGSVSSSSWLSHACRACQAWSFSRVLESLLPPLQSPSLPYTVNTTTQKETNTKNASKNTREKRKNRIQLRAIYRKVQTK
jgi:hypothetical protein